MDTTADLINRAFPDLPAPLSRHHTADLAAMEILREYLTLQTMIADAQARLDELRIEIINRIPCDATATPDPLAHSPDQPALDRLSRPRRPHPHHDH